MHSKSLSGASGAVSLFTEIKNWFGKRVFFYCNVGGRYMLKRILCTSIVFLLSFSAACTGTDEALSNIDGENIEISVSDGTNDIEIKVEKIDDTDKNEDEKSTENSDDIKGEANNPEKPNIDDFKMRL